MEDDPSTYLKTEIATNKRCSVKKKINNLFKYFVLALAYVCKTLKYWLITEWLFREAMLATFLHFLPCKARFRTRMAYGVDLAARPGTSLTSTAAATVPTCWELGARRVSSTVTHPPWQPRLCPAPQGCSDSSLDTNAPAALVGTAQAAWSKGSATGPPKRVSPCYLMVFTQWMTTRGEDHCWVGMPPAHRCPSATHPCSQCLEHGVTNTGRALKH